MSFQNRSSINSENPSLIDPMMDQNTARFSSRDFDRLSEDSQDMEDFSDAYQEFENPNYEQNESDDDDENEEHINDDDSHGTHDHVNEEVNHQNRYEQNYHSHQHNYTGESTCDKDAKTVQLQTELRKKIMQIQQDSSLPAGEKAKRIQVREHEKKMCTHRYRLLFFLIDLNVLKNGFFFLFTFTSFYSVLKKYIIINSVWL